MTKKGIIISLVITLVVTVFFGLSPYVSELIVFARFMTLENPVQHLGWEIPVPQEWWASVGERELEISSRPGAGFFLFRDRSVMRFTDFAHLNLVTYDEEKWKETTVQLLEPRGYRVVGTRYIPAAVREAYCVEAIRGDDSSRIRLHCILLGERMRMTFEGKQEHLPQFYQVAEKIRETGPHD